MLTHIFITYLGPGRHRLPTKLVWRGFAAGFSPSLYKVQGRAHFSDYLRLQKMNKKQEIPRCCRECDTSDTLNLSSSLLLSPYF